MASRSSLFLQVGTIFMLTCTGCCRFCIFYIPQEVVHVNYIYTLYSVKYSMCTCTIEELLNEIDNRVCILCTMAEMNKTFLIKAANGLMSSHPGPPTANIWWLNSNSL